MSNSHAQMNTLLIIVAIMAVIGGLAIVVVTSPQSWQLGPMAWFQQRGGTSTQPVSTSTPTPSPSPRPATATPTTAHATKAPVVTVTSTPAATATRDTSATVTPTQELPPDVVALAVVVVEGATRARLRDTPNGELTVTAVDNGTEVQVLAGNVKIDDVVWMQIRLADGEVGWMADYLLRITQTRP
jgi:cytoskeletal protein RodZ